MRVYEICMDVCDQNDQNNNKKHHMSAMGDQYIM